MTRTAITTPIEMDLYSINSDGQPPRQSWPGVTRLAIPSNLQAGSPTSSSILLTWVYLDNSQTGFQIQVSTDNAGWTTVGTAPANARSYNVVGLNPETLYYFRIIAVDSVNPNRNSLASSSVSGTTNTAGSWQLAVGHYVASGGEDDIRFAELIYPRPDSETPVWAKHRRHYPGIKYRVNLGVSFGSGPHYYEAVAIPPGSTLGAFLEWNGEEYIIPDNYGSLIWLNPTIGTYNIHIRVHFQDGATPLDIMWTLVVTTEYTLFMDENAAPGGDGSELAPFSEFDDWFLADADDRTYHGYQVCWKAGTYLVGTTDPASTPNMRFEYQNKPLVHYRYNDDLVEWDFQNATINSGLSSGESNGLGEYHFSDWYCDIDCIGGKNADNPRRFFLGAVVRGPYPYNGTGGGQRCTWVNHAQRDWTANNTTTNNAGIVFGSNAADETKGRNKWFVSRVTFKDISNAQGNVNWNGIYLGNFYDSLVEHIVADNTDFGKNTVLGKSSQADFCYRYIDYSKAPNQKFITDNPGEYAPNIGGGHELSYMKIHYTPSLTVATATQMGVHGYAYNPSLPYHKPNRQFRNSISKAPATNGRAFRAFDGWPTRVIKDIWCSQGDGVYLDPPENSQAQGGWVVFTVANNPFDVDMNLTGSARAAHLGTEGANIA